MGEIFRFSLTTDDQPKGRTELIAHAAVDEEVDGVAKDREKIDDERGNRLRFLADQLHTDRVLCDEEGQVNRQRNFDEQKDADDDNKHLRR